MGHLILARTAPINTAGRYRANFERDLIRERTGEGRKRAMANGVKFGRKRKLSDYQRNEAIKRRSAGETLASIAKSYGVDISMISRNTPKFSFNFSRARGRAWSRGAGSRRSSLTRNRPIREADMSRLRLLPRKLTPNPISLVVNPCCNQSVAA